MPTIQELNGIADRSQRGYALDSNYFPNGLAASYWSASADASNSFIGWYVNFNNFAGVSPAPDIYAKRAREWRQPVRLVRSTSYGIVQSDDDFYISNKTPNNRYSERFEYDVVEGNEGAIIDKVTELMWRACSEGQRFVSVGVRCSRSVNLQSWESALSQIKNAQSAYLGYQDWRLPNLKELQSIVAYQRTNPSINTS